MKVTMMFEVVECQPRQHLTHHEDAKGNRIPDHQIPTDKKGRFLHKKVVTNSLRMVPVLEENGDVWKDIEPNGGINLSFVSTDFPFKIGDKVQVTLETAEQPASEEAPASGAK